MIDINSVPFGQTYNEQGKPLSYKDYLGNWYKNTYNDHGKMTSHESSRGYKEEYTYGDHGNMLTYKNSGGSWCKCTYNERGQELTYESNEGMWFKNTYNDQGNKITYEDETGVYLIIADSDYFLMVNQTTGLIKAGCREFSNVQEALEHWNRSDKRAVLFTTALKKYFNL